MSNEMEGRVLARQLADIRELSLEDLEGIDGGATNTPQSCDQGPSQSSYCTGSWNQNVYVPCDLDHHVSD